MRKVLECIQIACILLSAFIIGYLTSNRTDFSNGLEYVLNSGVLIVLSIMFLIIRVKQAKKLRICCILWALFFETGGTIIRNIELYFRLSNSCDYILYALNGLLFSCVVFYIIGIVGSYYHRVEIVRWIITNLSVGYCAFSLISYYTIRENELLTGIINIGILVTIFFITKKEDNKCKIISTIVGGLLGVIM